VFHFYLYFLHLHFSATELWRSNFDVCSMDEAHNHIPKARRFAKERYPGERMLYSF
jgi:hypothetical protein